MGGPPGGGGGGMGGSVEDDAAVRQTVVEAETPTYGNIVVTGSFVGTVEPGRQFTVYPKANGEVTEANFKVGDSVEADDVLFKLDSSDLELDIAQSQATLAKNQAKQTLNLEKAQRSLQAAQHDLEIYESNVEDGLNSQLVSAEGNVKTAELALESARYTLRNARQDFYDYVDDEWEGDYSDAQEDQLREAMVTAEQQVETREVALENAEASLSAVKKQIEEQAIDTADSVITAESSLSTAELDANLTSERIALQKLQKSLENYTVKAPISGIIEQKNIDVYDTVSAQSAAYVISNNDALTVSFGVAESALDFLKLGDAILVEKNGGSCTGLISEISATADTSSGLYIVEATVDKPPFELRGGSSVKLRADVQKVINQMVIPIDAVYYDNGSPYVYIFQNNTSLRTDVELGISDAESIHVVSGLEMTDEIIVTYSANLFDGAEVFLPGTAAEAASEEAAAPPVSGEAGA